MTLLEAKLQEVIDTVLNYGHSSIEATKAKADFVRWVLKNYQSNLKKATSILAPTVGLK